MRARKRIISFMLAWLMIFSAAPQVFAATFDVGNDDQMASSWETASNNSDASNTFNMTNNINMEGHDLHAESGKTYVVNGNGHYIQNVEITGESDSDVIINANVSSNTDTALTVSGTSTTDVVVNGYVTTATAQGTHDGATALEVSNANVTVNGDVGLAVAGGSTNSNAYAVNADSGANIIINGDVFSAENGVHAALGADITINQNLDIVGNSMIVIEDCTVTVEGDVDGSGAMIMGGDVTVGGDLDVGGNIYISNGSLTMEDGSMLEADQVHIYSDSEVDVGFIDANRVTVGITGGEGDTSTLSSDTITNSKSNSKLEAGGKATVEVAGNVDNVVAKQNAKVTVSGTADSITKTDKAQVSVKGSTPSTPPYTPFPDDPVCSEPDIDYQKKYPSMQGTLQPTKDIITLCKEFDDDKANNDMKKHLNSIDTLRMDLVRDIDKLNTVGNAIIAQTILTIDMDKHNIGRSLKSDSLDESLYHPDTIAEFKKHVTVRKHKQRYYEGEYETLDIDQSIAYMYQDQLAESLKNASDVIAANASDSFNEKNFLLASNTAQAILGLINDSCNGLSPTTYTRAEIIAKSPAIASLSKEEQDEVLDNVEKMLSVYSAIGDLLGTSTTVVTVAQAILTNAEFLEFWATDYSCQIEVLDNLLKEQPMNVEMFYAAVDLRYKYEHKIQAIIEEMVNKAMNFGIDQALGLIPGFKKTKAVLTIAANTNAADKYRVLVEGVSSSMVLSEAHDAYVSAIEKVKAGDHSEEAMNMVYMTFSMYKNTMLTMCDALIANGDGSQAAKYRNKKAHLERLQVGQLLVGT